MDDYKSLGFRFKNSSPLSVCSLLAEKDCIMDASYKNTPSLHSMRQAAQKLTDSPAKSFVFCIHIDISWVGRSTTLKLEVGAHPKFLVFYYWPQWKNVKWKFKEENGSYSATENKSVNFGQILCLYPILSVWIMHWTWWSPTLWFLQSLPPTIFKRVPASSFNVNTSLRLISMKYGGDSLT